MQTKSSLQHGVLCNSGATNRPSAFVRYQHLFQRDPTQMSISCYLHLQIFVIFSSELDGTRITATAQSPARYVPGSA